MMDTSPGKKSAFGLSAEQIGRLLSIGSGDDSAVPPPNDKAAGDHVSSQPTCKEQTGESGPALQIEGYEIIEKVAEAGQGQVWRALQLSTGRDVAVKVPRVGSVISERARLRFEREIELAARLNHPNIARIYDSGIDRGQYYYVMDFIKGTSLDEYIRHKKLTHRAILELTRTICLAVQHAHQNAVIHRDLKPSNILVTEDGRPYLVDFGLAKALWADEPGISVSMDGETVGTPAYMSPEQAAGYTDRLDTRTDVYSLGVILFHLLTGQSPHDLTGSRQEVLHRIAQGQVTRPRQVCPEIDGELEWLLLKALDPDPDRRYSSAGGLAEDLRNYLDGAPLLAGPPSKVYRLKKLVMRNRTLVAAILIVALTIAVGSVVSMTMYVRAKVQSGQARAVSSFLNDSVLYALDPEMGQGGEVTPLSILNMVSAALEGRFQSSPPIEAELRHRLGTTYMAQGRYGPAVRHLERALEIRRRELGNDDLLTVDSMYILGEVYLGLGRNAEAEPLLLEAVTQRTRQLGQEADATLFAATMLGWDYEARQRYDRAMPLYQDVLKTARRVAGDAHPRAILAMYSIGRLNILQNRYDEAERCLRKALELSRQSASQVDLLPTALTSYLGMVYLLQGRHAEAEPILKDWVARLSRTYGESYWETLQSLQWLVYLYVAWDKPEETAKWHARLEATKPTKPANLSGSISYDRTTDTYLIRSSGRDIWDLFDDFHFAHKTLHGDGSVTARIDSVEQVNDWTKAGIMIRRTLEPSAENALIFVTPAGVVTFQYRFRRGGITSTRSGGSRPISFPHWIRLTRRSNTFTAEHSADGVLWEAVHSGDPNRAGPVEITMDQTVHVGLALTSHDDGRMAEARISNVALSGDTSPMGLFSTSEDISVERLLSSADRKVPRAAPDSNEATTVVHRATEPLAPADDQPTPKQLATLVLQHGGSVGHIKCEEANGTYAIVGAGRDIWFKSDEFHLAYKELTGDGSVVARIDAIQPVHPWTKAGVMMRNALAGNSEHASIFITPENRVCFQYRSTAGQNTLTVQTDPNTVTLPHWVKLMRAGNTFKAQHSRDGVNWNDVQGSIALRETVLTAWAGATEIHMRQKVYVGLAVTSHAGPMPAEAKISHVSVTGDVSPPGEFLWSDDIGFQMILLPKK